jgi:hypothetical protein
MFRGPSIRRLKRRVLLACALAEPPPVPPAPADGLYDDASVLSEAQRASAVKAVAMARAAGVNLHVALYAYIVGESIEQRAERLKEAWCPDGAGLLVVADTSTNQCTYLSHVAETEWLSTTELQRIFTESSNLAAAAEGTSSDKVLVVIENLAPRLSEAMARHEQLTRHRISPRVWWIFGGVTLASLVLAALAGLARWWHHRHRRASAPAPHYFPSVAVGERFGGPFGGGVIAEVNFGGPKS